MKNQKQSQSTHQNTQSKDSSNPQNSVSIRKAVTKLKQKQAQLEIIKKRFQVLKGQQDYNRYRTLDQQRRINHHNTLHQSIRDERTSLQKSLTKNKANYERSLKEKHDKIQQQMKDNAKQAFQSLYASRIDDRNKRKEQQKLNQSLIENNRKQLQSKNTDRKKYILYEQKKQIQLVNQYRNNRSRDTIGNRSMQASRFSQIIQAKDKQLQRMLAYEQQMLKKASQSIAMNQKLRGEYGKVFVEVKQKNSLKFPPISRQSHSYRSDQSNLSRNLSIYEI